MSSVDKDVSQTPTAPLQRWQWLRPMLPKRLQPYLRGLRKRTQWRRWTRLSEPFRTIFPYTQVNTTRQRNLFRLSEIIEHEQIPGAIVECGVLDGGAAALMACVTASSGRAVHLFDAWEGLPQATPQDGEHAASWTGEVVGSPARVAAVMRKLSIEPWRIMIHRGWFNETFPITNIPQIALLHIDADFYEPTKLCLDRWYPHISPGGFVQIDDYDSFAGCRMAVDEFLAGHPELTLQNFGEVPLARACYFRKP